MADKFQKNVKKWREEARKKRAKSSTVSIIREKKKSKPIARTGKCSPGKVLKGNKCVPVKGKGKKGFKDKIFGEGVLYKRMKPGDRARALSMRASRILKKKKMLKVKKK